MFSPVITVSIAREIGTIAVGGEPSSVLPLSPHAAASKVNISASADACILVISDRIRDFDRAPYLRYQAKNDSFKFENS